MSIGRELVGKLVGLPLLECATLSPHVATVDTSELVIDRSSLVPGGGEQRCRVCLVSLCRWLKGNRKDRYLESTDSAERTGHIHAAPLTQSGSPSPYMYAHMRIYMEEQEWGFPEPVSFYVVSQ